MSDTLITEIHDGMQQLIRNDVGEHTNGKGLSEKSLYKNDEV